MNRQAKTLLVGALVAVVALAFRVSWNAQRDIARTVGADATAALLYPFVVDGLMALALVATLVLTGTDRKFALRVLAGYTAASLVLNYVHGLVPALHNGTAGRMQLADWAPANWSLVLLATSLPVGSIFFGSDLVAKILHHRPADTAPIAEAPTPAALPVVPAVLSAPEAKAAPRRRPAKPAATMPTSGRRSVDDVLADARTATADWPVTELTADRIRTTVKCGAGHARTVRDVLRAERATTPDLPAVPAESEAVAA
ncbi:DUF2637 domain-containing protein [Streptomyces sp. NPDC008317]|uniref:DUF2637 domain-containing protein n=1 Tax=Streptomyces sp. NPDC008317 TaxID=3364827 RepID=UPI0036ED6DCE